MGWVGMAFSYGLGGDGFFIWVEWGRLFRMRTAFWNENGVSNGLNRDAFFSGLNEDGFNQETLMIHTCFERR